MFSPLPQKYCKRKCARRYPAADCAKLTDATIGALAAKCPRLASLDVSGVGTNISGEALRALADRLESITLDRLRPRAVSGAVKAVTGVMTVKVRHLSAAGIPALGKQVLSSAAELCPAMTTLDLTGSGQHQMALPWVALMRGCRGLRELRLNGMGGETGWQPLPAVGRAGDPVTQHERDSGSGGRCCCSNVGWPELRVLQIGVLAAANSRGYQLGTSWVCDDLLRRLLWDSPLLTELDITAGRCKPTFTLTQWLKA